jgi:hypothetical protein
MQAIFLRGISRTCSGAMKCFYATMVVGAIGVFGAGMLGLGYRLGVADVEFPEHQLMASLRQSFAQERRILEDVKLDAQGQLDVLALRMGRMQSHLLRLDALGERLVEMGKLDEGEFSFQESPAMGGPEASDGTDPESLMPGLLQELDQLERKISSRELQLNLLEDLIMNSNLEEIIHPMGQPVKHGFISSLYGMRNDPFSGKRTMHKGIDFAGKEGSDVVAVAAGVVTQAGMQSGYGMLVEINHGKGYVTRYGHNKELLVAVGDRVKPGQVIGKMGSTGRSTGPHVHFEVLRNDKVVNPIKYIKAERHKDNA